MHRVVAYSGGAFYDRSIMPMRYCYLFEKSVFLEPGDLVQIFRRIHAYLSFHIYLSDILHFSFLMHVTSKRGPYSFM